MSRIGSLVVGAMVGAGTMYLFDPQLGSRRRALLRVRWMRLGNVTDGSSGDLATDLGNRLRGLVAEVQGHLSNERTPDDVLAARVRSNLGRVVSNAGTIVVTVEDGRVTLSGPALDDEAPRLLASTRLVRGVKGVDDQLEVRASAGGTLELRSGAPAAAR